MLAVKSITEDIMGFLFRKLYHSALPKIIPLSIGQFERRTPIRTTAAPPKKVTIFYDFGGPSSRN